MKTLYVSDLDGTLLNSQQQTSTYTNQTIEKLVDQGMLFSYATARSYYSAKPATKGLSAKIPLILYNGAFIIDNQSQEILVSNFFLKEEVNDLAHYFNQKDFYPIVYAFINEQEKLRCYGRQHGGGVQRLCVHRGSGDLPDHAVLADGGKGRRMVRKGQEKPVRHDGRRHSDAVRGRRGRHLPRLAAGGRAHHDLHLLAGPDADDPGDVRYGRPVPAERHAHRVPRRHEQPPLDLRRPHRLHDLPHHRLRHADLLLPPGGHGPGRGGPPVRHRRPVCLHALLRRLPHLPRDAADRGAGL